MNECTKVVCGIHTQTHTINTCTHTHTRTHTNLLYIYKKLACSDNIDAPYSDMHNTLWRALSTFRRFMIALSGRTRAAVSLTSDFISIGI